MRKKSSVILLQVSNFASALGNSIVMITIPWLILERTDSPAFAGLVAAVSALPAIVVSPIGGWMVDHLGRRAVSIGADLLSSLSVAAFPIVAATFGLTNTSILIMRSLEQFLIQLGIPPERRCCQMWQRNQK